MTKTIESDSQQSNYRYWDESYSLKEEYRRKTKLGFSGNEINQDTGFILDILKLALIKLDRAIEKAKDKKSGLYFSYFINEPTDYLDTDASVTRISKFRQIL